MALRYDQLHISKLWVVLEETVWDARGESIYLQSTIEEDREIGIKFLAKEHIKNRFQLLSDLDLKVETSNEARRWVERLTTLVGSMNP